MTSHLPIEETEIYKKFVVVADTLWAITVNWDHYSQAVVGKQLMKAADSIGANLVEGDGRHSGADALHFFVISRGSARETNHWLERAKVRGLLDPKVHEQLTKDLEAASKG